MLTDTGLSAPPVLRAAVIESGRAEHRLLRNNLPLSRLHALGRIAARPGLAAVAGAVLLGLLLRVGAATGDLGLDEVWSLRLVETVRSLGAVFWGISHDNNHVLNSAWLYLLGSDRPTWIYRLPAVAFGTLTVAALARFGWRKSPTTGVITALLGAVALPLVDFGSEARGYAGLVLATVLAVDEADRAVAAALAGDRARCRAAAWRFGAAVGFGALGHLTMIYAVAVVGSAALARLAFRRNRLLPVLTAMLRVFWPSAVLALPACGALVAGVLVCGRFTIGDAVPFSFDAFLRGYGGMMLFMSGLPDSVPGAVGIITAPALLVVVARKGLAAPPSIALGIAALVVLPGAVAAARLPNVGYARYFSVCGIVLLMLQAEALGTLWTRGGESRRLARALLLVMVAGGLTLDAVQILDGRGGASGTLDLIAAEGSNLYAADHPVMAAMLLDDAAVRSGRSATLVPASDLCRRPVDWFIAVGTYDPRPDGSVTVGPDACRMVFRTPRPFPASPLSGTQWTLYRRG